MAAPLVIGQLVGQGVKLGYDIYRSEKARSEIKKLGQRPTYGLTPEMVSSYDDAAQEAKYGYTPQETSAFRQRLKSRSNTIFNRGLLAGGGGVSQSLNAAVLAGDIGAELDFAASGAEKRTRKRMYRDTRGDIITRQRNLITQSELQYRNMVEQALGMAQQHGRMGAIDTITQTPYNIAMMDYLKANTENQAPTQYGDNTGITFPKFNMGTKQNNNFTPLNYRFKGNSR
jgi:hypothetical protein